MANRLKRRFRQHFCRISPQCHFNDVYFNYRKNGKAATSNPLIIATLKCRIRIMTGLFGVKKSDFLKKSDFSEAFLISSNRLLK